jgi:uncharacterized protein YjdB
VTAALRADIVNQLQLACQQNASPWGAKAGPILYIGQMTFTAPFDLVSFTGDIPTGATIVNSTSIKYLKIRINSWNTAFPVAKMIFVKNDKVQFKYKYSQDTSQITASSVQAFFQFMLSGATAENITVTDNPASTIVKSITATLRSDTINQLQLACQQNASPWRAKAGPILYVSQMTFTMPTMVTGIAISGGTAITTAAGTLSVIATVTPTGATDNTVTWSVDKPAIATIDAKTGKLTAVSNGSVVVTATANDGLKVMATATIVVSGQVSVTTLTAANIGLYPNPVIDVLHLSNTASVNKVEIFNTNGQLVLMLTNTSGQMDINTMSLNNGVYILRAYTNNNVIMKQLVK